MNDRGAGRTVVIGQPVKHNAVAGQNGKARLCSPFMRRPADDSRVDPTLAANLAGKSDTAMSSQNTIDPTDLRLNRSDLLGKEGRIGNRPDEPYYIRCPAVNHRKPLPLMT